MMNRKSKHEEEGLQMMSDHVPPEIKDWLVAKQTDTRHPVQKMIEREQSKESKVPHMADGGMVPDDVRQWLEPRGAGTIAPSAYAPPPARRAAPVDPVQVPAEPVSPVVAPPADPFPPVSATAEAASVAQPDDYNAEADKIMGSSPEQRQAAFESTREPRAVNVLSTLGAGFGDAIARSYGRDAGAHHEDTLHGIIQKKNDSLLENEEKKASMGKERYGIEQSLEAKSATSPFSKVMQNGYRGILKKMGATDAEIDSLPASAISDVVGQRVSLEKALAEVAASNNYRNASLDLARETAASSAAHLRSEEAHTKNQEQLEKEKQQKDAAEALAKRGIVDKVAGMIPGTASHDAKKVLQKQMEDSGTPVEVERQTADGKIAIFDANTRQFLRYK